MKNKVPILLALMSLHFSALSQGVLTNETIDIIAGPGVYNTGAVIYKPSATPAANLPLVIYAHGMGEAGSDVNRLYNTGLPRVLRDGYVPPFEFIMVAPQRSSYSIDPSWLQSIIDESIKKWNIDTTRIYLTGVSAGGWSNYGSQLNINPDFGKKFAAIVTMSAATQDANKNNFAWWQGTQTPLWAIVGESDVSYRDQNLYMVNQINARVPNLAKITIRPGVGHGGWNDAYRGIVTADGMNMWQWLYQYKRSSTTPPPSKPIKHTVQLSCATVIIYEDASYEVRQ